MSEQNSNTLNRKWGFWRSPTTFQQSDDFLSIGTPDYLGWQLGDNADNYYKYLVNYGGGGFGRGLGAIGQVGTNNKDANFRDYWDAFREQQRKSTNIRKNLNANIGDISKAVAKSSLNQYLEGVDMAVNTWHPDNWDSFSGVKQFVGNATGSERLGKAAQIASNLPGKVLQSYFGPVGDAIYFGSNIATGQNPVRAGVEVGSSIVGSFGGASIGAALGTLGGPLAPITAPAGAIIGGFLGDMVGATAGTKAYELVTEDAWEKTRKLQERGYNISLDQVKQMENSGYNIDANNATISRGNQSASLSDIGRKERNNNSSFVSRPSQSNPDTYRQEEAMLRNINDMAQASNQYHAEYQLDNSLFEKLLAKVKQQQSSYDFLD